MEVLILIMRFTLNRSQLILTCVGIIMLFVVLSRSKYLVLGKRTIGEVTGMHVWGTRGRYTDPVVAYSEGKNKWTFDGESNLDYQVGDKVPVIYLDGEEEKTYIYTFGGFWLTPLLYTLIPLFILLAALLSFFKPKDTFLLSFSKPFGLKVIRNRKDVEEEIQDEENETEIRRRAYERMKTGKRRR